MTSPSKSAQPTSRNLESRDRAEYGVARLRDLVFDAVITLWRRRRDEGWTQKQLADAIGRDRGWVSRNLRAPGNWTLHTAGELVQALNGDVDISVAALEDAPETPRNFDAYEGYLPARLVKGQSAFMATIALSNPVYASIDIAQGERYEIPAL